jgi:hypothetical protein
VSNKYFVDPVILSSSLILRHKGEKNEKSIIRIDVRFVFGMRKLVRGGKR